MDKSGWILTTMGEIAAQGIDHEKAKQNSHFTMNVTIFIGL